MAGRATHSRASGGMGAALFAFFPSVIVIVMPMFTLSFTISPAQAGMIASMKQQAFWLKRWGRWVLAGFDVLIPLSIFASSSAMVFPSLVVFC